MTPMQLTRLRDTPLGGTVRIGRITYVPSGYDHKGTPCRQCTFGTAGKCAEDCGMAPACMAHLRRDRSLVVFRRKVPG